MAASVKNMVGVSQDSNSSSDDEALKRCQEAVWETRPAKKEDSNEKQSKRVVVAAHEHDGNELQVSQGFRTHVAKKLGHLLDTYISETHTESFSAESAKCEDEDDEGFRLFSTSVPGQTEEPPPPVRRRPVPSSSDSDSEMESRLREAAVSVQDLLPSLKLPSAQSPTPAEPEKQKKKKKKKKNMVEGENGSIVKKKRIEEREEDAEVDCTISARDNCEQEDSEKEQTQVKVKRKKKKKKEGMMN